MRFFVEADGVLLVLKSRFWSAYSQAVAHVGLARTDEVTFWRLVRTGAGDDRFLQRAKDHHLKAFRARFDEALESAEPLALMTSHQDAAQALARLRRRGKCVFFSAGGNTEARVKPLASLLKCEASTIEVLTLDRIIEAARSEAAHAVLAAEDASVRRCADAGLRVIGVASGSAIAKRLAGAGAIAAYRDIESFADAMDQSAEELVRSGIVLAGQR